MSAIPTPLAGAARAAKPSWAVACVLVKPGRAGVLNMALRHGIWFEADKTAAVEAAKAEALAKNPGWSLELCNAVECPRNAPAQQRRSGGDL